MEEHIKSYSAAKNQAYNNKQALKKKQAVIAVIIVLLIAIAAVICGIIKAGTHKAWLEYMDKYYYPFLEINNIDENNMGDYNTLWEDYHYKGKLIVLTSQRPREDNFEFYAELKSNCGKPDNPDLWDVSFDDYDYDYCFSAKVDRDGNWTYYLSLNYDNAKGIACFITEDGNIKEDREGSPPLTDNDRKVLHELLPQIREVQDEMRNKILKGLT